MNDAAKFGVYCKLTCLGGSEHGTCACDHPHDCLVRFDEGYDEARRAAVARMVRYVRNSKQAEAQP